MDDDLARTFEPLENARWGFESNCFVCEPTNDAGLGIRFFADHDRGQVVARFELDNRFSGAPTYLHGGVVLAVLDEAMSWATIGLARTWAVTKQTTTQFREPVRVGQRYEVTARVVSDAQELLECRAEVIDAGGTVCATAQASFVPLGPAQASDAIGAAVTGEDAAFVRR